MDGINRPAPLLLNSPPVSVQAEMIAAMGAFRRGEGAGHSAAFLHMFEENIAVFDIWLLRTMTG
ncbi:hypothetical protein AZH53_10415 [Methanomicrobiaceae archaeon CYW5]|nr:hypothetical protein [Methanovulcanius yangii]